MSCYMVRVSSRKSLWQQQQARKWLQVQMRAVVMVASFAGTLPQLLNFQSPLQKTAYLTARAKFTIVNCREERNCTKAACPVDCKWNDWSDWCRPQFLYSVLRDVLLSLYLFYFPSHHEMVCSCVLSFAFDLHCFHLSQAG